MAVAASYLYADLMTLLILKVISRVMPLQVSDAEEEVGLDISLHGEDAYAYEDMGVNDQLAVGLQS